MPEVTFGERVRGMRVEMNLSQDGLGALMPSRRHLSWVSKIENNEQEPNLGDLSALADALRVDVRWLLRGEAYGETEFIARLRGMERRMDERGRREVLATADRQIAEWELARKELRETIRFALVQAGVQGSALDVAVETALLKALGPDYLGPEDQPPTPGADPTPLA